MLSDSKTLIFRRLKLPRDNWCLLCCCQRWPLISISLWLKTHWPNPDEGSLWAWKSDMYCNQPKQRWLQRLGRYNILPRLRLGVWIRHKTIMLPCIWNICRELFGLWHGCIGIFRVWVESWYHDLHWDGIHSHGLGWSKHWIPSYQTRRTYFSQQKYARRFWRCTIVL